MTAVDVARSLLTEGRPVAFVEAVGRRAQKRLRVTIGIHKPRRTVYLTLAEFSDLAQFAQASGHPDSVWLSERAAHEQDRAIAEAQRPKKDPPKRKAPAPAPKSKPRRKHRRKRKASPKPRRPRTPKPQPEPVVKVRSATWPWKPPEPEPVDVDPDAWDPANERDPMRDDDGSTCDDWLWSNAVANLHTFQDLPPAVRRELDRHDWQWMPRHGDRYHVDEVQGDLADEWRDARSPVQDGRRRGSLTPWAKLTEIDVVSIHKRRGDGDTYRAIADDLGVSEAAVWNAANGRSWRHVKRTG